MMNTKNKNLITAFIESIWNRSELDQIGHYLHPDFTDHSLPATLPKNSEGLKIWIRNTGLSFEHRTIIDEMVCEDDKVIIKIRMLLKHVGSWREIEPTGKDVVAVGYRFMKIRDQKIVEHWGLVDGNAIEEQLKVHSNGCKIQV